MSWQLYEHLVHEKLREVYGNSVLEYNAALRGKLSKRSRQIDTLITTTINGVEIKTVVDSKYFDKKINIKIIESFIGFLIDIGAQKGIMVTNNGYTKSAIERIKNDLSDIELMILTMEELPNFLGFQSIVMYGPVEFSFESHPNWVVNAKNPTRYAIAKIYPKKYDLEGAVQNKEYIYTTIALHIDNNHKLIDGFDFNETLNTMRDDLFRKHPKLQVIDLKPFVKVDGEETMLMIAEMEEYSEYCAIIHYEEYTVLFGLMTMNKKKVENLKILEFFVSQVKPMFVTIPGLPNMSQMFHDPNDYHWGKDDE